MCSPYVRLPPPGSGLPLPGLNAKRRGVIVVRRRATEMILVLALLVAAVTPTVAIFAPGTCSPPPETVPTFRPDNTDSIMGGTGDYTGEDFASDGRILQWIISSNLTSEDGATCSTGDLVTTGTELDSMALASTCESDFTPYIANGWTLLPLCRGVEVPREREAVDLAMQLAGRCVTEAAPENLVVYGRTQVFNPSPSALTTRIRFIANDGGVAWLNGQVIAVDNRCSSAALQFAPEIQVTLRPGFNDVLIKTRNAINQRLRNAGFNFAFDPALIEAGGVGPVLASLPILDSDAPSLAPSPAPTVPATVATIEDIQAVDDEGGTGDFECFNSKLLGAKVQTGGVVTGILRHSFFIQDAGFAIAVTLDPSDDRLQIVDQGDEVRVTGVVREFGGFTEITDVTELTVVSKENPVLAQPIQPGDLGLQCNEGGEALEGLLVTMTNVEIVRVHDRFEEVFVRGEDGGVTEVSGEIYGTLVKDLEEAFGRDVLGEVIQSVTGVARYSFGNYEVVPRDATDVVLG
eukprot:scaffold178_cov255-Pinguiococcus_pyrenoidosus.AAC.10